MIADAPGLMSKSEPVDRETLRRHTWEAQRQQTVQRIVVVGGGFGGLYTVRRLE